MPTAQSQQDHSSLRAVIDSSRDDLAVEMFATLTKYQTALRHHRKQAAVSESTVARAASAIAVAEAKAFLATAAKVGAEWELLVRSAEFLLRGHCLLKGIREPSR